ncbi:MAG TPA: hypothetical protein VF462_09265 [Micromonosporaceae bacterium]
MVIWIVLAAVLLGLVVLAAAASSVLGRLPQLRRAARLARQRRTEAEALQVDAATLEEQLAVVQQQAARAQERIALIKAKRAD